MLNRAKPSRTSGFVAVISAAIAGAVVLSAQAPQQPDQPVRGSGLIIGRVVDGNSGAAIGGAMVTLSGIPLKPRRVIVDAQGRFIFHELPPGIFTITATRSGHLPGAYGTLRPDGTSRQLELAEGERVLDAEVKLWKFATISGTVTDDAGDAVPGTRVQALKRTIAAGRWRLANTGLSATTDERGIYRITGLVPGEYALVITSMISALPTSLLQLADSLRRNPGPAAAAANRELQTNGSAGFANDLMQGFPATRAGEFLLQGNMMVSNDGRTVETYPTVWYPAAPTPADASFVAIASGENRTGVDIRITLTRTHRISGTVTGPAGPMAHLALRLVPSRLEDATAEITSSLSASLNTAMTVTDASGQFTFLAVPAGQYLIRASTTPAQSQPTLRMVQDSSGRSVVASVQEFRSTEPDREPALWAAATVAVGNSDITGVSVTLRPGFKVTARVEFDPSAQKPAERDLMAFRLEVEPADGRRIGFPSAYSAQLANTLTLMPGRYLIRCDNAPKGWTVKSAIVSGRDVCDVPLSVENADVDNIVVTLTDRPSTLFGIVRDDKGQPDDMATVLVFPSDGNWTDLGLNPRRLRSVRSSRTGTFSFWGFPPGDYFIVAVSDSVTTDWQDPAFLQRLTRVATRLTLTAGQPLSQTLTTARGITR